MVSGEHLFKNFLEVLLCLNLIQSSINVVKATNSVPTEKYQRSSDISCLYCINCNHTSFLSKYSYRNGCKSCSIRKILNDSNEESFDLNCEREQKCCDFKQGIKRLCCDDNCNYISNYENFPTGFYSCKLNFYLSFTLAFVLSVIILFFILDFLCIKKAMNYEQHIRRKFRRLAIVYV
ncbi:unnamed protein product [Brachionus calyciflorus]|uniref:Uncharacterized protein n=1 Tax=Brachionus calyciflorus TaxID=104777 RepID=A0A813VVR8_9BILA|nr:unnamed protein product [Brachionus calyciflorus]